MNGYPSHKASSQSLIATLSIASSGISVMIEQPSLWCQYTHCCSTGERQPLLEPAINSITAFFKESIMVILNNGLLRCTVTCSAGLMALTLSQGLLCFPGGGFHHCSSDRGGGFCAYADITLAIKVRPMLSAVLDTDH